MLLLRLQEVRRVGWPRTGGFMESFPTSHSFTHLGSLLGSQLVPQLAS